MKPNLQIINPITYSGWDDLLISCPGYSFFHTSTWARVLSESYGYKPIYFTTFENGKISSVIPLMEINSFFTGKRGVSLPFTDYCEPILDNGIKLGDLINSITEYGEKAGWKYLEFRGRKDLFPFTVASCSYLRHVLDLSRSEGELFSSLRGSTKRNIKKANKEGVKVTIFHSLDSVKEFYRLNSITRKEHGLPPQPFNFFKIIYDHIISKDLGFVILASFQDKPISGAVYFHCGEKAVYKYGASDKNYQHLRANNLIMWEAIRWYSKNGYNSLCFGITEPKNEGLRQFKSGWGTREQQINYYRYDLKKGSFIQVPSKVRGFHNKIFKNIPIPILSRIGNIFYRHVG